MTALQDLITYVRARTLMQNAYAVSDTDMTTMINYSLGALYGLLVTRYEDYFLQTYMSVIDGTQNQNLSVIPAPSNLMKIRAIDYNTQLNQQGTWYTINQFQLPERNQYNNPMTTITQPWGKVCLAWRLGQDGIIISPANQAQGIYQVWYVPQAPVLVNLTDTVPINMDQQGWLEYAVSIACIRVMNALKLDSSVFEQEAAELRERIKSEAKNRQAAGGKRIANTRYNTGDMMYPTGNWNDV